ncbi:MAG: hypothetical protein D6775_00665 [Caldilineae bacterium]|nr:MAG: hypothetical protein D6775_00665 [Caldilineae bacterium]
MKQRIHLSRPKQALTLALLLFSLLALFPGMASADSSVQAPMERRRASWRGVISAMPAGGRSGVWVIGGREFVATSRTRLKQKHGPLGVGVCAEVKYRTIQGVNRAYKIESDYDSACGLPGTQPPAPTGEVKGTIDSMPAGRYGVWIINGVSYSADSQTRFRMRHGRFAIGRCVEVKYADGNPRVALKISTERDRKCNRFVSQPVGWDDSPAHRDSSNDSRRDDRSGVDDAHRDNSSTWDNSSPQEAPHAEQPHWDSPSHQDSPDRSGRDNHDGHDGKDDHSGRNDHRSHREDHRD